MAHKTIYTVPRRRVREGKTNYKKRLVMLKSRIPRLVIRKGNQHVQLQIVDYEPTGDKVLVSASSQELKKKGWAVCNANLPEFYLTGLLLAKKAKEKKIKEAIVDAGLYPNIAGSRIYASVKGALEGGLAVHTNKESFPSDDRVSGKHIAAYAAKLAKEDKKKYDAQFSRYINAKIDPAHLPELVNKVKASL